MADKPNFQQMSRQDLRAYVLTHREDDEALRIYMDRLRAEPGIIRHRGGLNDADFLQLEQFLARQLPDRSP
ncbi:MAG: hypothetical protein HC890_01550 [Chloroflexaceae bacterium]|nr:hypothetical protein [Chloroflexaceae bacterium]